MMPLFCNVSVLIAMSKDVCIAVAFCMVCSAYLQTIVTGFTPCDTGFVTGNARGA